MPQRDTAAILILGFLLAVSTAYNVTYYFLPTECASTQQKWNDTQVQARDACRAPGHGLWAGQIKSPTDEYECRREYREHADVRAQQSMAECTWEIARASQFGNALLFLTLFAAVWAAYEAKNAAAAADKTWRATERPWLSIERFEPATVDITEDDCIVDFSYAIKNVGNTPATSIFVTCFGTHNGKDAIAFAKAFVPGIAPDRQHLGYSLFPNKIASGLDQEDSVHFRRVDSDGAIAESCFFPAVAVAVEYRSPNHNSWHVTTAVFEIGKNRRVATWGGIHWGDGRIELNPEDLITNFSGNRAT